MEPKAVLFPHCSRTETAMIGCICATGGGTLDEFEITEAFFYTPAARSVFAAAKRLHKAGKRVEQQSIYSELGPEMVSAMTLGKLMDLCEYVSPAYAETAYAILCEKLSLRRANELAIWLAAECQEASDISAFCATAAKRAAELEVAADSENELESAVKQAHEALGRMERGERPARRMMPVEPWNKAFGGISDGLFYAIASRPGMGKTALMEQFITSYLQRDETVLVFEKDMSPQMLVQRIACREAGVPYWRLYREVLNADERMRVRTMLDALDPARLIIKNPIGLTAEKLCSIAKRDIRSKKVKAVFLDHIGCLRFPGRDLREGLTMSSLALRNNVTETGIPHLVLAHINRDGAKGRPQPENIKEFDQLFGDVDALAILWSEIEAADAKEDKPMKLYAAKHRGGAVVEESLNFNGPLLKFT